MSRLDIGIMIGEIIQSLDYRRGDFYLGSLAKAILAQRLKIGYPFSNEAVRLALVEGGSDVVIDTHDHLKDHIKHMKKHPMKECPHCGQMMEDVK